MADEELRSLGRDGDDPVRYARQLARSSGLDERTALVAELTHTDPELGVVEQAIQKLVAIRVKQHNDVEKQTGMPTQYLLEGVDVFKIAQTLGEALVEREGFTLGYGWSALAPGPFPSVVGFAVRVEGAVHFDLRAHMGEPRHTVWTALQRLRFTMGWKPPTIERHLRGWLDHETPIVLKLEPVRRWVAAHEGLASASAAPEPEPTPAPRADPNAPATPAQQSLIESLSKQAGLDAEGFSELLVDEGWMQPASELTKTWASIVIDVLRERLGIRYDVLPEQPVFQPDEGGPTERQLSYLCRLKGKLKLDDDAFRALAAERGYVWTFDRLTREWCSLLIDALKAAEKD